MGLENPMLAVRPSSFLNFCMSKEAASHPSATGTLQHEEYWKLLSAMLEVSYALAIPHELQFRGLSNPNCSPRMQRRPTSHSWM